MGALRVCASASAAERLDAARTTVLACTPGTRVLIVGATRGAADDLARDVARSVPATFGIERLSLTQLAARTAMVALAAEGVLPSTWLGAEAVATRAAFEAARVGSLTYLAPVAGMPGFPRALARTVHELRLAGAGRESLASLRLAGPDLADLLTRVETCFADASSVDRAGLLRVAARLLRHTPVAHTLVLLDLSLDHEAERELVGVLVGGATATLATAPRGDRETVDALVQMGGLLDDRGGQRSGGIRRQRLPTAVDAEADGEEASAGNDDDLSRIRRHLFEAKAAPSEREPDGSFQLFSAPGEGRESVEIARRILHEARRGVRFDEMAILVRSPQSYAGLLEHALARAEVPLWLHRGTKRPHPAGRAFLALLACAAERLSAARFAEYLSLGQVPRSDESTGAWEPSRDEAFGALPELPDEDALEAAAAVSEVLRPNDAVAAGTLRAPWRWETLLAEAAVIGRDLDRWHRRLDGRAKELERQKGEAERIDGDDGAKVAGLDRAIAQLAHLRTFALPIIEQLAGWPERATWGEWLDELERLAPRVLRMPAIVLRVLADLRPMAGVGPIDLDEARRVLSDRLLSLESEPPSRRFGRVFVGTPEQARGRSFRVVFVPGLAERMFPQRPREDPLLLDELRVQAHAALPTQRRRLAAERLLLQLAAGSATERLYVSYPRIDLGEARARVPSFYALDVMRAVTGRVPDHETLEDRARAVGSATLAWPAPPRPEDAIDDQEHDLSVLRLLLDDPDPSAVRGHAHYLLKLNPALRRSVVARWARGERRWSGHDGLLEVTPHTQAAFAAQRLTARSYSLSALQRFSACPYQFVLAAFFRLHSVEAPEPLQRMDPLTRGSLFHAIQARFLSRLRAERAFPVTEETLASARVVLDEVAGAVTTDAHDELAPAVERVWQHEVSVMGRDLHAWLDHLARSGAEWEPILFEFAFGAGSVPGERDPMSVTEDAVVEGGFRLRGAIDLIEEHRQTRLLRVTNHKTGRKPDRIEKVVIGGGAVLQPVLYAVAVEAALGRSVSQGRLFYCTSAGSFYEHPIPFNDRTRPAGLEVLQVIDRAIASGRLVAAPTEDACQRCDFVSVCGPDVYRRVSRKPQDPLADLAALRSRP